MVWFENKVALVTGGGSGVGRTTALTFAREGAKVAVVGSGAENTAETVALIEDSGGVAIAITADVANGSDVEAAVEETVTRLGRLDCAFNNAGVEGRFGPLTTLGEEVWDRTIAVNLKGVWLSLKYEIPAMLASGGGTIVNTSTDLTVLGLPGTALYTASKSGVDALTRCAATDFGREGVRVNAVGPGNIEGTPLTGRLWDAAAVQGFKDANPLGKIATTQDVAEAVVWLCSDRSGHVNGQVINIDGGLTLL
jgi:NAD(P)-dependent dehydrogenase (short-subunit alcohol dehydrogenase family)